MAITICLINQKGGCGKSSTCFHLAGAFAAMGQRVLLVDTDPQASLSQGFFGSSLIESLPASETLAALLGECDFFSDHAKLIRHSPIEGISVCVANHHLGQYNAPLPERTGMQQFVLRDFLQSQCAFDVVLLDCPPNLYLCSWTAMIAADFVVIPVPPEDFGTQGLRAVHQAIDNARRLNPRLRRLGHLVTRFDRRLLVHRSYESRLRELYRESVLETIIPEASAFKVALACRKPVEQCSPQSKAAKLTKQLAHEILERAGTKYAKRRVA